jgi:hypothetical protein
MSDDDFDDAAEQAADAQRFENRYGAEITASNVRENEFWKTHIREDAGPDESDLSTTP